MLRKFFENQQGNMATDIGKAALAIAFLSVMAANWLSNGVNERDRSNLAQLASSASKTVRDRSGVYDPVTTGSLQSRAADTRLDPCALPRR